MTQNKSYDMCQMSAVYSILTNDGQEPQPILTEGDKMEVFETLRQYAPDTVSILEFWGPENDRELLSKLNGSEWLRENNCPTCGH